MIDLINYFSVNWDATADNIRAYIRLSGVSRNALAKAMLRTKRTVDNWCNGSTNPSIDDMIFLAKFFNVDLLDILVTNGRLEKNITKQVLEEAEDEARKCSKQINFNDEELDYEFNYKEEVINQIVFNEYVKSTYPVTNINEFLSFIPLVEPSLLSEVLYRISGNVGIDNNYVFKQLKFLYDSIKDEKAKKYVEFLKRYDFEYPSINSIDNETKLKVKLQKFQTYLKDIESDDCHENYCAYMKQLSVFGENAKLLNELRFMFEKH